MKSLAFVAISYAALVSVASADSLPNPQDRVVLSLQHEGWVTTSSANVDAFFNITQQRETASELKIQILASLEKLAPKANWYITATRVNKDNTGLNRWYVSATARVAEEAVSALNDRAEDASRGGFKVSIGHVDFSPTLKETNALKADLRSKIYAEAAQEAERLSKAISGAKYHVQTVDFLRTSTDNPRHQQMLMRSKNMAVQEMSSDSGGRQQASAQMPISKKHVLSANVILSRVSE